MGNPVINLCISRLTNDNIVFSKKSSFQTGRINYEKERRQERREKERQKKEVVFQVEALLIPFAALFLLILVSRVIPSNA